VGAEQEIRDYLNETAQLISKTATDTSTIRTIVEAIAECFRSGGKILLCGNGGSAADAQHLAAEFVNRFRRDGRALPAIALTTDTSVLTSIANDSAFERIFARQLEAIGRRGDCLIAISTSGKSANVLAAAQAARNAGIRVIALTGKSEDGLAALADIALRVPSKETSHIQEVHIAVGHLIAKIVEEQARA